MNSLQEKEVSCPYCGELINVLIEFLQDEQVYIEDCQVCCRPIQFHIWQDVDGDFVVSISHENE